VENGNLVIFIGAGVSQSIGCASWEQLAQNLIKTCHKTKRKDGSPYINFKQKEKLSQYRDPKKIITICHQILQKNDREELFIKELEYSFEPDEELLKTQNIYDELHRLPGIFITTNADENFDDKFHPSRIAYKEGDFNPLTIDTLKLYHIHGSILDSNSLIFTVPKYIKRYRDERQFISFMEKIFFSGKYVVLFIGYGVGEFELLEFILSKFDSNDRKELKHFTLLPFYKGEENIRELEQLYFDPMGIEVVGYEMDEKGYGQLYDILKSWNSEIRQVSTYLHDSYQEIEDVANNYEKDKADKIFQIIKKDPTLKNFLFEKLASSTDPFPWLKPLKEKGYLDPENNPSPQKVLDKDRYFTDPYWNVLRYLENIATQNAKNPSDNITESLLYIVNSISSYRNEEGERIENYWTDWFLVKMISQIPLKEITQEHIEFIRTSLKSKGNRTLVASEIGKYVLPNFINNEAKELVLKLIDVILDYQRNEEEAIDKYTSIMDEYWLKEALKKHKPAIARLCGIEAAEIALKKMLEITKEDESPFNYIWIPTVEDHPQTRFLDRYDCQLVHFVRDMFELSESNQIKEKINDLLKEEHPIFKRIAIHTINHYYKDLNELFWNWGGNPLEEGDLKHELYELLKSNYSSFSKEQIKKVLGWIESKHYYISGEIKKDKESVEKTLAYYKKEWLSALLGTKDMDVISSYEKYQQINPEEREHPGFLSWTEFGTGIPSPIEKDDLLNKSNDEIAEYLINYKEGKKGFRTPSIDGLSFALKNSVSESPEKFANNMGPFLNVQLVYQHTLLQGLFEAWRANKEFNWDSLLTFMYKIIESDEFWNEKYKEGSYNYRNWIISQIADLIIEGTRDDKHAFDAKLLPQAEKILLILVEKTESDLSETHDIVTSVLNSSKGRIFSAMVNYSLRYARLSKKDPGERWIESIKEDFNKRIDRKFDSSLEFSVILGEYLANLIYLDKKWVIDNINRIFPRDDETHWEAAFTGYLFYSSPVYKDIYLLIRENNHYTKALQTDFIQAHITERLLQHICLGYIEGWEKLGDSTSLISKLIKDGNINQISEIISFFWMLRDKLNDKIKSRVKPLWKVLFELLSQNEENPKYQEVISKLSDWLSLIDEIDDDVFKWLKLSAKYKTDSNTSFFIEYLLEHAPKTPVKVGEIYLEMLSAGVYPVYKKENIEEIVKILYEQSQKQIADRICNMYGAKNIYFLREMYEKYRNA